MTKPAVEKRKAFVDYASKDLLKINTPYRNKEFRVKDLLALTNGSGAQADIIDLWKLTTTRSNKSPFPFFAYVSDIDADDPLHGKVVKVGVVTSADGTYDALGSLKPGMSQLFTANVVVE